MPLLSRISRSLVLAVVLSGGAGGAAFAQANEEFYRGKTLQIDVGFGPGGGYDLWARTLARHIGKHIPGHPAVLVQNIPGAGSLTALSRLYNTAPKDGTVIAAVVQFHCSLWFTTFTSSNHRIIELFNKPEGIDTVTSNGPANVLSLGHEAHLLFPPPIST